MLCPSCQRTFNDPRQVRCPDDGTRLVESQSQSQSQPQSQSQSPAATGGPGGPGGAARATLPSMHRPGAIIDWRYALQRVLGEGGMARVYLAEDTRTKELVAVKILGRDKAVDRFTRERFFREVEVAAELGHPSIVTVLDAGEHTDGSPFLVLEYLRGESLGELLRREGQLDERTALDLAHQASSALAAAHAAGVIHRDVKPDNMFLVGGPDGDPRARRLKVMDFGMAKLREGPATANGNTLGTVPYMAPEQAMADPHDARVDVYAMGVMIFRMLAGRLPFDTHDDARLVAQHLYVAAPRLAEVRPDVDPRIDALVTTALRKLPANRYVSMSDLVEDMERIMGRRPGDPVGAPMVTEPDVYSARNPMSKAAAKFLRGLVS